MKKSLIAMAVAASFVAPVAFADTTISGFVEQEFSSRDYAAGADAGMNGDSDVSVIVTVSEDLGNGMSAFAKIDIGKDDAGTQAMDQIVGLSGGFGTVVVGRMEDFTEGKVMSMASIFESDSQNVEGGNNHGRTDNGMAYVSPNMSGFQAGIAGYAVEGTNDGEMIDAYDMMVSYSNGPITVRLARESSDSSVAAAAADSSISLGAQYNAGAFSVVAVMQKANDVGGTAGDDRTDWMLGGSYTFGNNKVVLAYEQDEVNAAGLDENNWQVEMQHMFSKRTKAYVGHHSGDAANTDATYVGLKHTF